MKSVLSTKILQTNQKHLLFNSGLQFVEYDAIKIEDIPFECPKKLPYAVVSSKNAVRTLIDKNVEVDHFYCVGEKTMKLLEENGKNVIKSAKNGQELANFIQKNHKIGQIYFFSGDRRRDELPDSLRASQIPFHEIITYRTLLSPKKFDRSFNAILFFSPSGVESHLSKNDLGDSWAICIGNTTADAVPSEHKKIAVANTPTIESVIAKTVKTLLKHD